MKRITYFDVEYANTKNKSICQVGIACDDFETSDPCYPELNIYINPEDGFDDNCIRVHGITKDKVSKELTFPEAWLQLEKYFTNTIVVGHNVAGSDLDALVKNLKRYNLDIPQFYYICTLELAKEFVPRFAVEDYKLSTLCSYFDIDIDSEHDAFDDACACADLFRELVQNYDIKIDDYVKLYIPNEVDEFISYVSNPLLRKSISEFYGMIKGISLDKVITDKEIDYLKQWKKEHQIYENHLEIKKIINEINEILKDDIVTFFEIDSLQLIIKSYLDIVNTSPVTLSTQILNGIMKGITFDRVISEDEIRNLRQWLYDNIYLEGHYPFDKLLATIEEVVEDGIITNEELNYIQNIINSLLDPVEVMRKAINTVENKIICLSGVFEYGEKKDVERYIVERGGIVVSGVSKKINYLIVGNLECQAYANGTYGTKVKKAIELNEKGANILIIKENDLFDNVK